MIQGSFARTQCWPIRHCQWFKQSRFILTRHTRALITRLMKTGVSLTVGFVFIATIASAHADGNSLHRLRLRLRSSTLPAAQAETTFTQTLDHFNPTDTRTFQQRYFLDRSGAKSSAAPVVFYVCGEGNCAAEASGGWASLLAQQLGANFVALEHRYYGESQPFAELTTENLQYLSVEQAIEDLASFQKWMMANEGLTGKWVTIGGSYPADLAAIYRLEHPELVSGAIA